MTVSGGGFFTGLFDVLGAGGVIRDLGVINLNVTGMINFGTAGTIVATIRGGGRVCASYMLGGSVNLVASFVTGGGLAGSNDGEIRASYATAAVRNDGTRNSNDLGGLAGFSYVTIISSYAVGAVPAAAGNYHGGFIGRSHTANSVIVNSYCELASGQNCVGRQTGDATDGFSAVAVEAKTAGKLRTPIGYVGIYREWNIDLDEDGRVDCLWNFGAERDYPALNTPGQRAGLADSPPPGPGRCDRRRIRRMTRQRIIPKGTSMIAMGWRRRARFSVGRMARRKAA